MTHIKYPGTERRVIEIYLEPGESVFAEPGVFVWGDENISPTTSTGGLVDLIKRKFTGERLFKVEWKNRGNNTAALGLAGPPGNQVLGIQLADVSIAVQHGGWIAAEPTVKLGVNFQLRPAGFFGGEGVTFQNFTGPGKLIVSATGDLVVKDLADKERLKVDTGLLVAFEESVHYGVSLAGGLFTMKYGGEGALLATVTGPGRVILQSHSESVQSNFLSTLGL